MGILQGITEWLPISSKAMVALAARFMFGIEYDEALSTAIWLHTGTLLAAIIYFREDIASVLKSLIDPASDRKLLIFLAISTAVTGLLGVPLLFLALNVSFPEAQFTIGIGLLLLVMAYLQKKRPAGSGGASPSPKNALIAGFAQGLAAIPGISRSGSSLAALMGEGFGLREALRLSFLMSIPAVMGVEVVMPALKGGFVISMPMLAGSAFAAIVGLLTIRAMLGLAARADFYKITMAIGLLVIVIGTLIL